VERLADAGVDFQQFLAGLGEMIRAQLSLALGGEALDVSDTARQALHARRGKLEASDLLRMLNTIAEVEYRFKRSGQQQLLIETMLVRFALMDRSVDIEQVLKAIGGASGGHAEPARRDIARAEPPVRGESAPRREATPPPARVTPAPPRTPTALAPDISAHPALVKAAPDITAITGRWDELIERVKGAGKALLAAALEASSPHAINRDGDLTIRLDEPNDFHAKAIDQARSDLLAILNEWFTGLRDLRLLREGGPQVTAERPARVTDEMVKTQRLNTLRRKDPGLDAAIDVLDLEIVD
jgi:DNA polymerase-3 subunit gamma/tau